MFFSDLRQRLVASTQRPEQPVENVTTVAEAEASGELKLDELCKRVERLAASAVSEMRKEKARIEQEKQARDLRVRVKLRAFMQDVFKEAAEECLRSGNAIIAANVLPARSDSKSLTASTTCAPTFSKIKTCIYLDELRVLIEDETITVLGIKDIIRTCALNVPMALEAWYWSTVGRDLVGISWMPSKLSITEEENDALVRKYL
jgi:hypothetical protein